MKFVHRFNTIQRSRNLIFFGIILLFSTVIAAETPQTPIHIEADRMVSQEQDQAVIFMGNVDARQGELLIRTDEMTVYYNRENAKQDSMGGSSEINKLICKGNVQISQGDWLGKGGRMDYFARERKVVLSQNAKAWQGQNMVAGKTITYFLDDGRSIVEGQVRANGQAGKAGSGRVKAVIQPEGQGK